MSGTGFSICGGSRYGYGYKLIEAKCSVCGKKFLRSDKHGWNAGGAYQCSYSCYRIPEEKARQKFRQDIDKRIAAIDRVDQHRNDTHKRRIEARKNAKQEEKRKKLEGALESAIREVEACDTWAQMFTARASRYAFGSKDREVAQAMADKWVRKLEAAQQAVDRIEKEMEANKNVQSTSEKEAAG